MSATSRANVRIFPTGQALDDFMLREWTTAVKSAISRRGRFVAALSGGTTPVPFYKRLARSSRRLPWENTHIFLADERCVPIVHRASNYGMLESTLLGHVPIPPGNVHAAPVDLEPRAAAQGYESEMRRFFGLEIGELPRFDLILLGLGEDGHTASLFPGDAALAERQRLAVAVVRPAPDHHRVTLTLPVINAGEAVFFLVTGRDKAAALRAVLEGPLSGLPAAQVRPQKGRCMFLADRDAAALLTRRSGLGPARR